jgi:hypothetical protein
MHAPANPRVFKVHPKYGILTWELFTEARVRATAVPRRCEILAGNLKLFQQKGFRLGMSLAALLVRATRRLSRC